MTSHVLANTAQFAAFSAEFARDLRPGDVVALSGPLGAGKTTFVRGVVESLHGADTATSPTFTFRHRYAAPAGSTGSATPIEHLDLYRVESAEDLRELGLEDAFAGDSIVLVEWWQRAPELLPTRRYEVHIDGSGDSPRTVAVRLPQ